MNVIQQKENKTIYLLKVQIEITQKLVEDVDNVYGSNIVARMFKIAQSGSDLNRKLDDRIMLLNQSKNSLYQQLKLVNQGILRGQNIQLESINDKAFQILEESETAMKFWSSYVSKKSYSTPVGNMIAYFMDFIKDQNAVQPDEEEIIDIQFIDLIVVELVDTDNSGFVSLENLRNFFVNIWDKNELRLKLNSLGSGIEGKDTEVQYTLIRQLLVEIGRYSVLKVFKQFSFNSKMLMASNMEALTNIFDNDIDEQTISLLYSKVSQINSQIQMFLQVEQEARKVEAEGIRIAGLVEKAKVEGRLKHVKKGNFTYYIEDPENGDGLCEMHINDKIYQCERRGFKAFYSPGCVLLSNAKVYCLVNVDMQYDKGYVVNHFLKNQCYYASYSYRCYRKEDGQDRQYQLSVQYSGSYRQFTIKKNFGAGTLQQDGEAICQTSDLNFFKQYYSKGTQMNWMDYRKKYVKELLDMKQISIMKKEINDSFIKENKQKKLKRASSHFKEFDRLLVKEFSKE